MSIERYNQPIFRTGLGSGPVPLVPMRNGEWVRYQDHLSTLQEKLCATCNGDGAYYEGDKITACPDCHVGKFLRGREEAREAEDRLHARLTSLRQGVEAEVERYREIAGRLSSPEVKELGEHIADRLQALLDSAYDKHEEPENRSSKSGISGLDSGGG